MVLFAGSCHPLALNEPRPEPYIENVWSLMVHELEEELRQPARQLNQDELWAAVLVKWEELRRRPGYFRSLVASMRLRRRTLGRSPGLARHG